jgi:hypothetical protein
MPQYSEEFKEQANAALFQYQYVNTISDTSIAGLTVGDSAKITVALDNGGTSNISQTWTSSSLQAVTFDFNNGGLKTTFYSPWGGSLSNGLGIFATDGTGTLTSVMDAWQDIINISPDYTSNSSATPLYWYLNGLNEIYGSDAGFINLSRVSSMVTASNWAPVSAVPVPAAVWLFGTALIGLVGISSRRKVA